MTDGRPPEEATRSDGRGAQTVYHPDLEWRQTVRGSKPGDRFVKFKGRSVYGLDELHKFTNRTAPGESIKVIVQRGGKDGTDVELTIKTGEGL